MKLAPKSPAPFQTKAAGLVATKSLAPFQIKETNDEGRTFTGIASTWDLDLGGDLIQRGAFKATLEKWQKAGRIMPLLDSHNAFGSVESVVGKMLEAKETKDGLECSFQLLENDRKADAVYTRLKAGYVDGLSIGYRAIETREPDEKQRLTGVWRIIKELELMEVSVVLWPMNPDARVEQVKALLMGADPARLTEDDRKTLRAVATQVGFLLRPVTVPESAAATTEEAKQEPQDPDAPAAEAEPDKATPEADSRKAEDQTAPERWQLEALQERLARLNANRRTQGEE